MSVTGQQMLVELRGRGLRLSVGVDSRLRVSPRGDVTPDLDERIRANKLQLLEALAAEQRARDALVVRIREMAERWAYSEEELAEALECAAADPDAWRELCDLDEHRASLAQRVGRRYPQ